MDKNDYVSKGLIPIKDFLIRINLLFLQTGIEDPKLLILNNDKVLFINVRKF